MAAGAAAEQDPAVRAALILVSLRSRKLREFPEWAPMPSGEASSSAATAAGEVPERWPKRPRSGRPRLRSDWKVASLKLDAAATGSGAWSSREERERSPPPPPRARARHAVVDAALYYGAPAGSGPSTSADRALAQLRHAGGKAVGHAPAAAAPKEPMEAPSPETPLDFGGGGSGASSSLDDASQQPPSKRKGHGSGGASSGDDEGCSSPAKRTRADASGKVAAVEEKAISVERNMQSEPSSNGRDESGKLAFDLNLPWPENDDCSAI